MIKIFYGLIFDLFNDLLSIVSAVHNVTPD